MENRYEKIVLNVSAGQYAKELSVYEDKDGNRAVIPAGWTVSGVRKENTIWGKGVSLVIYQIPLGGRVVNWKDPYEVEKAQKTYSQFVWVPVKFLDSNGTIDGEHFSEKFGRRNYRNNEFSDGEFYEPLKGELLEQYESVNKYGGFYISRYNISKSSKGEPQSVRGIMPWNSICFNDAKIVASAFENNEMVKSHLPFGAEYDSVLEWFIKSEAKTLKEISEDSNEWGNHSNTKTIPKRIVETGSCENWCVNNLYDFAGNVDELTQEIMERCCRVIRGGNYAYSGEIYPAAYRNYDHYTVDDCHDGFHIVLYIKYFKHCKEI